MAVALYARVSTVGQAQADLSIPDQLQRMRQWCADNGLVVAHEYVEPGASATDDQRPVFREMIAAASHRNGPYEAIVVHSRSRIFRNLYDAAHYRQKLARFKVRVISITQPTTDDENGELMENVISMMDEYSSKENSKHTRRNMQENARRGFFNGSRAPFGYESVTTNVVGHKGKFRKKLAVNELEAQTVRRIYDLYLHGHNWHPLGYKAIVNLLNAEGSTMRGSIWRLQKVADILADTTYRGEYCFNMRDSRNEGRLRPESEWVRCPVPAIIDEATFDQVRRQREYRDPKSETCNASRAQTNPTLLAGLVRCGCCGVNMTKATGKGGRYVYYRCGNKFAVSTKICDTPNVPVAKLDQLILERMVEQVLKPERVTEILKAWLSHRAKLTDQSDQQIRALERSLRAIEDGLNNLYSAIEKGVVSLDSTLQARVASLRDDRDRLLAEVALLKSARPSGTKISPKQIGYATARMRELLLDTSNGYGKQLLLLLVDEIRVEAGKAVVTGSNDNLNLAVNHMQPGAAIEVPRPVAGWRPRQESNLYLALRRRSFYPL